jgi:hypothetical protein
MKKATDTTVTLNVSKDLIEQANGMFAWVFDKAGNLVEKQPIRSGRAQLKTGSAALRGQSTLYIAPDVPEVTGKRTSLERLLQQAGAYRPSLRLSNNVLNVNILPDLQNFFFKRCHITGGISKSFNLDGVATVQPVCNVRVHICEVDPIWLILPRLPDRDILDIRDGLLDKFVEKVPPIPDPIGPVAGPILSRAANASVLSLKPTVTTNLTTTSLTTTALNRAAAPAVGTEVIAGLSSASVSTVREALLQNITALLPYLCLFPKRWPFLYRCDEIAVVQPDCNGRFEHTYFYFNTGDKPDIYIWVEANINGSWETVYRPPMACATRWDYLCGSDIHISLTDDRVHPCECAPMPGAVVWMKRVGNGVSIRNIRQSNTPSAHLGNAIGLTNFYSSSDYTSPFGSGFPFVVQFGSGYPSATVTHYRWKYRQVRSATLSPVVDTWKTFEGGISKAYTYERVNSDGDTVFYTGSFKLGPEPSPNGSVYRIPHDEASVDVPTEPTAEWNQDTYSVNVDSLNLNDGLYEFLFELIDAAGNVVPQDKDVFVVDKLAGEIANPLDAPTITAFGRPEGYVLLNGATLATGFRFVLRVDNDVAVANIHNAQVDGSETETICGFGQYSDKATSQVTLIFEASQPQRFAHYSFSVVKGNGNPAGPTNTSGYVTQANNGYAYSAVDKLLSKDVAVSAMLGACNKAAFAENLYVAVTHTNGSRRLTEYDRSDTAAFAIEPENP